MAWLLGEPREENARLRQENAEQAAELERLRADLAVLQRGAARAVVGAIASRDRWRGRRGRPGAGLGPRVLQGREETGPGGAGGQRDYSHLPRFKVVWGFGDGGYCCPQCGEPFTLLGATMSRSCWTGKVIVRVAAHCRRYKQPARAESRRR